MADGLWSIFHQFAGSSGLAKNTSGSQKVIPLEKLVMQKSGFVF